MKLPESWIYKDINSLVSADGVFIDGDWVESKDQDPQGDVRLIQLADIKEFKFLDKSDRFLTLQKSRQLGCTYLRKNDVLVARMPDPIGRACLFPYEEENKYVTVVDVAIIRPDLKEILPKWLMYFINAPQFRERILQNSGGSTRLRISRRNLGMLELPFPLLPEQKRIVAKLDTLFAYLDQLRARLEKIPILLKQFRKAVLTQAVTGKLTEEWRGNNPIQESGKQLLERIEKEIREEYEKELHQQNRSPKPKLSRGYKEGIKYDLEKPEQNLPNSWAITVIDRIGNVFVGGTPSRKIANYWNGNIHWVSSGEVANNRIHSTNEKITEVGLADSSVKLLPKGTVLIAMIGEGKTRGQSAILEIDACTNQNVAAIVARPTHFVAEYLWYYLLSSYDENREQGRGGNQPALNGQKVGGINVNVPPLLEQKEIVCRIESLFTSANSIDASYQALKEKIDHLLQAILSKAFRGELVKDELKEYSEQIDNLRLATETF